MLGKAGLLEEIAFSERCEKLRLCQLIITKGPWANTLVLGDCASMDTAASSCGECRIFAAHTCHVRLRDAIKQLLYFSPDTYLTMASGTVSVNTVLCDTCQGSSGVKIAQRCNFL